MHDNINNIEVNQKVLVGQEGIEPPSPKRLEPKSSASTYFATGPYLVGKVGLEPTHPFGYKILNLARLPIPPLALILFT